MGGHKHGAKEELIKGHVTHTVSPVNLKLFSGYFSSFLPEVRARFTSSWMKVLPPFLVMYGVISWAQREEEREDRKTGWS